MIQAQKDANAKEKKSEDQVQNTATPRTVATAAVRTVHVDSRRATYVASALGTPTTVILSDGGTLPESGAYQYHRVALGTQLQHMVTPVQVSGGNTSVGPESSLPVNSRCVTTSQDLTHILVAVTTNSAIHSIERQPSTISVNATTTQPSQAIGTIANVVTSNQRTATGTILAQSVPQTSLPQRIVLNSGMSDVYVRLPPSAGTSATAQFMVLESSAGLVPPTDVTKVHSYSLASAVSALSSSGGMQKVVISTPGQHLQAAGLPHKAILTTAPQGQVRTATKRVLSTTGSIRTDASSPVNSVMDVMSRLSVVNKLLSGLITCEGKIPSIPSSPKQKKMKLDKTLINKDIGKRKKIIDYFVKKMRLLQFKYYNQQAEYFFLKNGGNIMDHIIWKKKIPAELVEYLRANRFDPYDDVKVITDCLSKWFSGVSNSLPGVSADLLHLAKTTSASSSHPQSPSRTFSSPSSNRSSDPSSSISKVSRPSTISQKLSKQNSISSVYDSQIGSQEEIVERAKQEAYVMQRVGDLRKEGLWSLKRLPKVSETPRIKAHWDYLLEEMAWLATDFAQERKWKKAAAKKCARMITKYFQEKEIKAERAEKEEQMRMRKIASMMAREVKQFWNNIEKLVEYRQQTWLEEKRKKVLDVHLNFIVDQTEKYSSWLTQGMNRNISDSPESSRPSSPQIDAKEKYGDSSDFEPENSESDDEETIKKEEEDLNEEEQNEEIKLLQKESEMSLEDFLETLPPEILSSSISESEQPPCLETDATEETPEGTSLDKGDLDDDADFEVSGEEEDDEQTILEQEMMEIDVDHRKEIEELNAENELSIEELRRKYESDIPPEELEDAICENAESESSDENDDNEEEEETNDSFSKASEYNDNEENPSKEISDIAATAESFQPKGNTLSTTQVYTKVPFLLKHTLREYQHIGLDWLNAMYDKKLNGILADEMGLGKTIQTISILAHLSCEKGVWGPHLIVVPTSVMLNWEMEFKKWCPAFKILTYYGTPKERKQKRVGWTKPNAFHVCITSYKLVVQDHQSFRRKKWKYLILDEAQHIKNFKSQRWQLLLNFQSSHRLLLTGTPLQNNLMELWSLMHFLMPNVFQSHKEFKEWFVNPVTGMIEGSHEYNDSLIKRLHKVLRPFLLRRLKSEVEKQLPKKYEHVIMCRLSKRQRYLYDDFMSQTKTKETLATGNFMSVINILMQLRKVCNHPNMFEERPTVSSFLMEGITFVTSSLVHDALQYDSSKQVSLYFLNLLLADLEILLTAYAAHRVKKFQTPPNLIIDMDSMHELPPPCPQIKLKVNFCNSQASDRPPPVRTLPAPIRSPTPSRFLNPSGANQSQRLMVIPNQQNVSRSVNPVSAINQTASAPPEQQQYTLQLVQPGTAVASLAPLGGLTLQLQSNVPTGNRVQCLQSLIGGIGRMVQAASGTQWLITSVGNSVPEQQSVQSAVTTTLATQPSTSTTTVTSSIQSVVLGTGIATATVIPQVHKASNSVPQPFLTSFNRPPVSTTPISCSSTQATHNKPIGRVAPLNVHPPTSSTSGVSSNVNHVQPSKSPVVHSLSKPPVKLESSCSEKSNSLFYLESLSRKREQSRKDKLTALARINSRRCTACPIYGGDLVDTISFVNNSKNSVENYQHKWGGYLNSANPVFSDDDPLLHLHTTRALVESIKTAAQRIVELMDIVKRFVFVIPAVSSPSIQLHVSHPAPSWVNTQNRHVESLESALSPVYTFLHPLISNMKTQFPELRLIQYDCGKLQRLSLLLRDLKSNHHRVLIFTQMTRMLDILEQFLNYHGHTYLRLDGNTKVEQRQALMERFNADKRIFCFILSTRSGGIGVNLTGADTVIFYDSDWNPTMDAQAQDRCHRIGQTRDVHIYRLISERTVEENILKKANQKRLLGDLAIEGGNFNTAFFKKNSINELFGIELQDDSSRHSEDKCEISKDVKESIENFSPSQFEQALGMAEEEMDLEAAKTAHAEAAAEFAEFDESIPLDNDSRDVEEKSPAEEELEKLMEQLTPVEKYAVQFLESLQEPLSLEQLKLAEEEIEAQKKDWELGHLKALKEEEEKRLGYDDDSPLFCSRDSATQVYYSVNGQEEMPVWAPPTPPTSENDIYLDPCLAFWYEHSVMHESRLPPVYTKKEPKRQHVDPIVSASTATRKQKVRKDDMVSIPRSLFDRPSAAILKMRREVKLQKVKGLIVGSGSLSKPVSTFTGLKQPSLVVNKPQPDAYQDKPEWLVHEDFAILQVIQDQQGIPLSLTILMPAHTPNWDLAADAVNAASRVYRSARLCKARYENVIVLREEGKILYDTNLKKPKKTKGIYKTKNNRPMKTSHLYQQDNNSSFTSIFNARHKIMMEIAQKRKLTERQSVFQPSKGSKMVAILADGGINYDDPLIPMQIAANRAERIAREKQKNQPPTVQAIQSANQVAGQTVVQVTDHPAAQRQVQQPSTVTVTGATSLIPQQAQAVIASLAQAQQLQHVQLSKANLQPGTVASVSLAKSLTNSIMVNAAPGAAAGTFATITKALGQAGVSSISAQGAVQNAAIAAALSNANLRNQRTSVTGTGTTTTMTVQEMVAAAAAAGQVRTLTTSASGTSSAPAVVSVAGLATVQLAASQRISGTAATTVATVGSQMNTQITTQRNITQLSQIQAIRQTALIRQREQQNLKQQQQLKRLQVQQQQQAASQPATKVAGALTVAQQRVAPQQVTMKQSRPLTDAEMTQFVKRQQLQQQKQVQLTTAQILAQAQLQQVQPQQVSITGGTATLVKTVSAPSSVAIPVSAVTMGGVNINVSMPQGKTGAVQTKGATTITNQQLRQFQIQQQLLNQARKGNKVATNLTQLAKVSGKASGVSSTSLSAPVNAVQIVQHNPSVGTSQQVKGLPTAMTVQQIQQAMKAIPQNLPVVVTATPSLPGIQHSTAALRGEPGVVSSSVKAQTTTLPSTTLTTSGVLKGTPAVVVGQQQTAAILQQVAASSAALSGQHAVTLAVRATGSQAQGQQQVQIQVQPSSHSSLVNPQSQVVSATLQPQQTRIQQLSQNASTINIASPVAVQNVGQASSILSPSATIVQQMPADSTIQSPTHVMMHSVAITNPSPTLTSPNALSSPQTTSVQAVIQAARQQQAAQQQQKASPYTMRLRNPPK